MSGPATYEHRQFAWATVGAMIAALLFLAVASVFAGSQRGDEIMLIALLLVVTGAVFSSMTVRVADGELRWWLGNVRAFGKRIRVGEITSAEPTKTNLFEGWGIHLTIWHGWVWNVSGFNAVEITLGSGARYAIGTDEPQALVAAIEQARRSTA